jgi:oligogalacturonide lyase
MKETSDWICSKSITKPATGSPLVLSRRLFLSSFAGAGVCIAADQGVTFPSEIKRYTDQATDFVVFRLTDPAHQSWLPSGYGRVISKRGNFMLYASDRSGTVQAYRMDLKPGQSHGLTNAKNLEPSSLTMTPDERNICYFDGPSLYIGSLSGGRPREVYQAANGQAFGRGFSISEDGLYGALVEQKAGTSRLRLITMRNGSAQTLAESNDVIADPMPRPRRAGVLYRRGESELWLVNFDGAQNRKLRIAAGGLGTALWSPDGRTILYLNFPSDPKQLNNVRESTPDTNEDRLVSKTSQFVTFNRNSDASVLVGASSSKASPFVLLLVRAVRRELTLCEHRATQPRTATPIFSPNSQRIFFQSDRDGKSAIYSMVVDKLVEETETEDKPEK